MPFSKKRQSRRMNKTLFYVAGLVVLAVVFASMLYMFLTATPQYSKLETKSLQGYSYKTFEDWSQASVNSGSVYTMQYNDYISDKNDTANKSLYAQHIVSVELKAIPTSALTEINKTQLKTELAKTDGTLFASLQKSIEGCSKMQDATVVVNDSPVKDAFVSADLSFYCVQLDSKIRIRGVGRVIFSDDGSAVTVIILAADTVFNKNEAVFKSVLDSVIKQ